MPPLRNPADFYQNKIETISTLLKGLYKRKRLFEWLRLSAFAGGLLFIWLSWSTGAYITLAVVVATVVVFLVLVTKDASNQEAIDHNENLVHINKQELLYLQHQYTHQKDGSQFLKDDHPYAADLDIFGRASIFQYINRTNSEQGNELLATWLSAPASAEEILKRQNAARELADRPDWRQELQAITHESPVTIHAETTIESWLKEQNTFIHRTYWQVIRYLIPIIALSTLVAYIVDFITYPQFMLALVLFFLFAFSITRKVLPIYSRLNKIAGEVDTLAKSISLINKLKSGDPLLNTLQTGTSNASTSIHQLHKIFARFDYRLNPLVYIPLNIFLLWDLQQVLQLEKWKEDNTQDVGTWFRTLAAFEALSSIATLTFNHPNWSFPELNTAEPEFTAVGLGHPLIDPKKSVVNSFSTVGKAKVSIITGSNMAGKSTFLRSVGVNLALAGMGAPVYASSLKVSPLKVMSSMRVKDNLEESTSTFYAELKKLKGIIDAVKRKDPVFILLDEILRGTNSHDRHAGSSALIKQLIQEEATGIIATHDLELASLEKERPEAIHNFHFDVQVNGPELYFDYTLKTGICQSFNASILMKKIGIEL
jgi:hypothetical protein